MCDGLGSLSFFTARFGIKVSVCLRRRSLPDIDGGGGTGDLVCVRGDVGWVLNVGAGQMVVVVVVRLGLFFGR